LQVTLLAVLERDRLAHTIVPGADQERTLRTLDALDRALEEKQTFLDAMDGVYATHGLPGAGGLLTTLDDAIDERDVVIGAIDTLCAQFGRARAALPSRLAPLCTR
jgi:hypothetical protein